MSSLKTVRPSPRKQTKYSPPDFLKVPDGIRERYPTHTLRWIKISDRANIYGGKDYRGWELVHRDSQNDKLLSGVLSEFSVQGLDSTYRIGDLILARMPKDVAEARNEMYVERNRLQMNAIKDPKHQLDELDRNKFQGNVDIIQS